MHFAYKVTQQDAGVQLVIETPDKATNARIFEALEADREKIEHEFGGPLQWDRVESRKRCFIWADTPGGGYRTEEGQWPEIHGAMVRLDAIFRPRIANLPT